VPSCLARGVTCQRALKEAWVLRGFARNEELAPLDHISYISELLLLSGFFPRSFFFELLSFPREFEGDERGRL